MKDNKTGLEALCAYLDAPKVRGQLFKDVPEEERKRIEKLFRDAWKELDETYSRLKGERTASWMSSVSTR